MYFFHGNVCFLELKAKMSILHVPLSHNRHAATVEMEEEEEACGQIGLSLSFS